VIFYLLSFDLLTTIYFDYQKKNRAVILFPFGVPLEFTSTIPIRTLFQIGISYSQQKISLPSVRDIFLSNSQQGINRNWTM